MDLVLPQLGAKLLDKVTFCIDFLREYGFEVIPPEDAAKLLGEDK